MGCVRTENQDRILADDELNLYVVCDGIGGRRRGHIAAELAVDVIRRYIEASREPLDVTWPFGFDVRISVAANRLLTASRLANRHVWLRSEESLEFLGMGTTIAAVLSDYSSIAVANVGDSRAYLVREGKLRQLTVDDTLGPAGGQTDPGLKPMLHGVLTSAAGSHEDVDVHLKECALQNEDRVLVCSDGLHGCVGEDHMGEILLASTDPAQSVSELIAASKKAGANDNVSAIVILYRP